MELRFSAEDEAFRDRARTWLAESFPEEPRPTEGPDVGAFDRSWQRTQWEGGWAGVAWPVRYGGLGLPLVQQLIWFEEYARCGAPDIDACFVGLAHAGPTLMARATEEQRSFHLPKILTGEVSWCQGFSEPEAGSDLASLRTRAVRDGDVFVVSGQKIWTSFADSARYQELLVRTDPEAPKHRGITWLICDMQAPGIEVRPIRTMDGRADFCEVFYDEVRVPVVDVVGAVDDGWSVAMATLAFERGTAFTAAQVQLAELADALLAEARTRTGPDGRRPALAHDDLAQRIAVVRSEVAALRAMTYATVSRNAKQDQPGPEGSIIKLYYSQVRQDLHRLAADLLGVDVLAGAPFAGRHWSEDYLASYSASIGGGTSEIQRNIIGERVLGLPR